MKGTRTSKMTQRVNVIDPTVERQNQFSKAAPSPPYAYYDVSEPILTRTYMHT